MTAWMPGPAMLQARLALVRFGWGNILALLLCAIGAIAWLGGVPHLRSRDRAQHQALVRAQQALRPAHQDLPAPLQSADQTRLAQFYDVLGAGGYEEQQVKTLFALAARSGLTLQQADYKLTDNKDGRYQSYQIALPIHGPYRSIREFCEQTLLAVPFASLDQIDFRREAIGNTALDAHLRFTLYLSVALRERQP